MKEDDEISSVAALVKETMERASKRRAAQAEDTRSLEERIALARDQGLLADASDLARLQQLLADAHLILWRVLGSLGEGLTEPALDLRLRAALVPTYLRPLAQGAEALLAYAYKHNGGAEGMLKDRAEHREAARELRAEACTCDACLKARAAGRGSYRHAD